MFAMLCYKKKNAVYVQWIGIKTEHVCISGFVYMSNVVFKSIPGISLISPSVVINELDMFSYCQPWEWNCPGLQIQGGNANITNITVFPTVERGITLSRHAWFNDVPAYVTITGCNFYSMRDRGIQSTYDFNLVMITNSTFVQTGNTGLQIRGPYMTNATYIVRSSTFINNTQAVNLYIDSSSYILNFEFSDNIVLDEMSRNYLDFSGVGVTGHSANSIRILNNKFLSLPYTAFFVNQYLTVLLVEFLLFQPGGCSWWKFILQYIHYSDHSYKYFDIRHHHNQQWFHSQPSKYCTFGSRNCYWQLLQL